MRAIPLITLLFFSCNSANSQTLSQEDREVLERQRDGQCEGVVSPSCAKTRAVLAQEDELVTLKNIVKELKGDVGRQVAIAFEMKSYWGSNCSAGPITTSQLRNKDGWTDWTSSIYTSEWDGAPWSCLQVRTFATHSNNLPIISLKSDWGTCSSNTTSTEAVSGNGWSDSIYTSEWNGAPWSCLSAKIDMPQDATKSCNLELTSEYASNCSPGPVKAVFDYTDSPLSEASKKIYTSEWDGAPWSCLSAKLVCN